MELGSCLRGRMVRPNQDGLSASAIPAYYRKPAFPPFFNVKGGDVVDAVLTAQNLPIVERKSLP